MELVSIARLQMDKKWGIDSVSFCQGLRNTVQKKETLFIFAYILWRLQIKHFHSFFILSLCIQFSFCYTSMKLWMGYNFASVCMCVIVCLCVCLSAGLSLCLSVRLWTNFRSNRFTDFVEVFVTQLLLDLVILSISQNVLNGFW